MPRLSAFATVFCAFLSAPTLAATTIYECQIKKARSGDWIPETLFLAHDTTTGEVLVSDPIIFYYNEERPLPAEMEVENAKRTTFRWRLQQVVNRSGQRAVDFRFRATFFTRNNSIVVTSQPAGFSNTFRGKGACTLTTE